MTCGCAECVCAITLEICNLQDCCIFAPYVTPQRLSEKYLRPSLHERRSHSAEGRKKMKKILLTFTATLLAVSVGAITGSSANAVNCQAFNQGTGNAFHVAGAAGAGLYKIAEACHM